ncbi:hypothetical protein D3C71_653030 [compost metagenome]
MQDLIGRVFAFGDFQHAGDCLLAQVTIGGGFHDDGELVQLLVAPVLLLLGFTVRAELYDKRGDRVVDRVRSRPVTYTLDACRVVDLRPVFLHLDLDIETDLLPHLDHDLRIGSLVGVVVVEQAIGDRITLVVRFLEKLLGEIRIVFRRCPAFDEHV